MKLFTRLGTLLACSIGLSFPQFACAQQPAANSQSVYVDVNATDPCWVQRSSTFYEWTCAGGSLPPEGQQFALSLGVIVADKTVLVIDSGATAMVGQQAAYDVQRKFPDRKIYIVNTQAKPEHVLGNIGFQKVIAPEMASTLAFEGRIVGSRTTANLMRERCPDCIKKFAERMGSNAVIGTVPLVPGLIISRKSGSLGVVTPEFADWRYELVQFVETEETMMIYNPSMGIYWVGNAIQKTMVPDLYDGRVSERLNYLNQVYTDAGPNALLLSVHGPVNQAWLRRNMAYFTQLQFDVLLGMEEEGVSEVELINKLTAEIKSAVPNLTDKELEVQQLNVQRAYRELEESMM